MSSGRNRAKVFSSHAAQQHRATSRSGRLTQQNRRCRERDQRAPAQLGRPAGRQSMPPMPSLPTGNSGGPLFAEEPIDTDRAHSPRSTRSAFRVRAWTSKGIRSRKTARIRHRTNQPVTNSSKSALSRLRRAPEDALACSDLATLEPGWPRGPAAVFGERKAGR